MGATILASGLGQIGMSDALAALKLGRPMLDVIEAGIMPVEADPTIPHVGIGGAPNLLGALETDAAIMDSNSLRVGAVGALQGYMSSIWVARQVLEVLPHTLIVGEGAALFAAERGAEKIKQQPNRVAAEYRVWLENHIPAEVLASWPNVPMAEYTWPKPDPKDEKDTVIYLARK